MTHQSEIHTDEFQKASDILKRFRAAANTVTWLIVALAFIYTRFLLPQESSLLSWAEILFMFLSIWAGVDIYFIQKINSLINRGETNRVIAQYGWVLKTNH